jgi:endonuclease G
MNRYLLSILFFFLIQFSFAQDGEARLDALESSIQEQKIKLESLSSQLEDLRLNGLMEELTKLGLPEGKPVMHLGMVLSFNENTHQASWVSHVISRNIADGSIARTNDFRDDPLIQGEGLESDYFLKQLLADGTFQYDGFGYDRGHLAPSADFRWSPKALSESYFYTNMSPMHPDFNREAWAEMEGIIRAYVERNNVNLYVVTLPVIRDEDQIIERGTQKLKIPGEFVKVVMDPLGKKGVAFKMPNKRLSNPLSTFCFSIDEIEAYTGFDFYSALPGADDIESSFLIEDWFPSSASGGVEPLLASTLSPGNINTTQAKLWMGSPKKVNVCGTVVSTRFSGSGNYWLNLDRKFPDTVFSIYIRKEDFIHFDSIHKEYLLNEKICVEGKVSAMYSLPNMNISKQEVVTILVD